MAHQHSSARVRVAWGLCAALVASSGALVAPASAAGGGTALGTLYMCVNKTTRVMTLAWSSTVCPRGTAKFVVWGTTAKAGATGPAGPAGARGAMGLQGATGAAGVPGAPGAAGPTGATGPVGPAGAAGATGVDGITGPTGPAGPTGTDGAMGTAGTTGSPGSTGATGATGATGRQGEPGTPGPAGQNGSKGATGAPGFGNGSMFESGGSNNLSLSTDKTTYSSLAAALTPGEGTGTGETTAQVAGTLDTLGVTLPSSAGAAGSFVFTVMLNGAATSLTCTISGPLATTCSDSSNAVAVAAGDKLNIRIAPFGSPNAQSASWGSTFSWGGNPLQ